MLSLNVSRILLIFFFRVIYLYSNVNDFADVDDDSDSRGISQWVDLAKVVCDGIQDGPPPRRPPGRKATDPKDVLLGFDEDAEDTLLKNELENEEVRYSFEELRHAQTYLSVHYTIIQIRFDAMTSR